MGIYREIWGLGFSENVADGRSAPEAPQQGAAGCMCARCRRRFDSVVHGRWRCPARQLTI